MDKKKVGNRIREFAVSRMGSLKALADALSMTSPSLQSYLTGRSLPGAELLSKLRSLGCDLDWLLLIKDDQTFDLSADKVSARTNHYESPDIKDKVIISQAEEILRLKEEVESLKLKRKEIKS